MNYAKKALMFLGSAVLVAALVSVLAPKATHALVATLVQVANTSANPVPNKDVDNPGRSTLVVESCSENLPSGLGPGTTTCEPPYAVQTGYRLAIQQVEAKCATPPGQSLVATSLVVTTNGVAYTHQFPLVNEGKDVFTPNTVFANDLAVHFYADPGSQPYFGMEWSDNTGNTSCQFQYSGYLISYP